MWHFRGIFVSGTYLEITYAVSIVAGNNLVDKYKNVGSVCPFNMIAVRVIFAL